MVQQRMEGWKEMAAHLGRSVRTIQRWEREAGLPVHRLQVGSKAQVFAYKAELDGWRVSKEEPPDMRRPGLLERWRIGWLWIFRQR
ncbi:hypothetical protein [uncultured Paludibaculum sp.]|uniref:hypothetical protein n=1 Tax=uncultured Paludibaculum sp. TaxID=1765020 RepID=UPI002AABE88C|nr:hypothetical protein [uncultured Paludibaculum sp.]